MFIRIPATRSAAPIPTGSPVTPSEANSHRGAAAALAAGLSPSYFAMVMATGIVSLSAHMLGPAWLASALFFLNIAAYVIIWVLYLLR
ncbi:MAG: hypothetical protein IT167_30400, partial [Bryobacterales bacterium]|nr:hypothetical protein [Bryobacterales bacterium]